MNPSYIDVDENSPAEVECFSPTSDGNEYYWTRLDGQLTPEAQVENGILRFAPVRRSDAGDYQCSARNAYGDDTRVLHVYVRERNTPPPPTQPPIPGRELSINPSYFNGRPGDVIVLTCRNLADSYANVDWSKEGVLILPAHVIVRNGVLTVQRATAEDSGRYVCTTGASGQPNPSTEVVDVFIQPEDDFDRQEPPRIEPLNNVYNVIQGNDFELICQASGSPYPQVSWKKIHEEIGSNVQINGNVLKIMNAQMGNRGVYVCSADSNGQIAEQSTIIDIERK